MRTATKRATTRVAGARAASSPPLRRRRRRRRRRPRDGRRTAATSRDRRRPATPRHDDGASRRPTRPAAPRPPTATAECETADDGQAAAAVVHPGAVRRLLRRGRPGLLRGRSASTSRSSRAASTSSRRQCWPTARSTSPSPGCPRRSQPREQGADIVNIAQIFQRSGTLQVSFKDDGITTAADFAGQEDRQLGLRQRVRDLRRADRRPASTRPPTSRSSSRSSTWTACSTATSTPPRR